VIGTPALTPMEIGCAAIVAAADTRRKAVPVFVIAVLEHVYYRNGPPIPQTVAAL